MNDAVNAAFELVGALLMWVNVRRIYKDKGYAGVSLASMLFFTAWGVWNIYYYPSMNQTLSAIAAAVMTAANVSWCFLALTYGYRKWWL